MSETEMPNQNSNCSEQPMDYLNKAAEACAEGDMTLGLHLYLAAYEKAIADPRASVGVAVAALREAWHLACDLKERSMAEHVFEKLEPYLTGEEISKCAMALQNMALERLEEYGISRKDLEDMAEAFSNDFVGEGASVVKVEHISIPHPSLFGGSDQLIADVSIEVGTVDAEEAPEEVAPMYSDEFVPLGDTADAAFNQADNQSDSDGVPDAGSDGVQGEEAPSRGKQLGMGVSSVFNPYDMYPPSSEGTSWRAATNIGSGWNESVGFDGTTTFDSRFEGFSPVRKTNPENAGEGVDEGAAEAVANGAANSSDESNSTGATDRKAEDTGQRMQEPPAREAGEGSTEPARQSAKQPLTPPPAKKSGFRANKAARESGELAPPQSPMQSATGGGMQGYRDLTSYDEAVSIMRDYGFGLQNDPGFISFVGMLNEQHGLKRLPAADTVLFRAPAIEDATHFVDATIGELGLPSLRMAMEEGMQGMPVLCVTADGNNRPRMNHQQNRFQGPAILVIDNLDTWQMPEVPENVESGMSAFVLANMTRGAREAVNLIRSAVEDPQVFVLATASMDAVVDPFFYEVLEPLTIVDIGNPNDKERKDLWTEIMRDHPSMQGLDVDDLVRYSSGLARYDIVVAAREAIDEAYKLGLVQRTFVPVTSQNIFDKLAAMQPLDSDEYHALEERVIGDFVAGLDEIERLLDDSRE